MDVQCGLFIILQGKGDMSIAEILLIVDTYEMAPP